MTSKLFKLAAAAIISSATALQSIPSFAGEDGSPFEGLYIGLAATKSTFDATATHQNLLLDDVPSNFNGVVNTNSGDSYGGGFFAGYGLNYGILYGGAEAAFLVEKGSSTFNDGSADIRFFKSNTIDINLRGGVTISNKFLLYGLFGYTGAVIKSKGVNGDIEDRVVSYNRRVTGYRYGGGVEVAFMENLAARLEYTKANIGNAVFADGSDQFTVKPRTSRIMFSVVLHMY